MPQVSPLDKQEIQRRRTFAIISHPDAGKTTMTERLLYTGGVIHETGDVKAKAGKKTATSDWMELEKQKGISITSSAMTFDFLDQRVNLLDTPGHKDFSEDTYRVLMAVDSACMLIDVAKGVEDRTKKLYEVCRYRQIPMFTFVNKLDREGKGPLQLIDEIESTLGMSCVPITWPVGIGSRLGGFYHRYHKKLYLFNDNRDVIDLPDPLDLQYWTTQKTITEEVWVSFIEEYELMKGVYSDFSREKFLAGKESPVFFGSAKQNFGIYEFLEMFCNEAPSPLPRVYTAKSQEPAKMDPLDAQFTGFVFKIQANMDRRHRDRVAFLRVCSGKFERGMKVQHNRLQREIRLAYSTQLMADSRETVDTAYAGDIVGVSDTGYFAIGDSVGAHQFLEFEEIPKFAPELFAQARVSDAMKRKKLHEALNHLYEEGAIQLFFDPNQGVSDPIIGVVGELQFEVLIYRLQDEYNLEAKLNRLAFSVARWPTNSEGRPVHKLKGDFTIYQDMSQRPVLLLNQEWDLNWAQRENADVVFQNSIRQVR